MKTLSKLALISAMAISANAMAMQALDDETLSAATGQDGITIKIFSPEISIDKLYVHDNDGLAGGGFGITAPSAGTIIVDGVSIKKSASAAATQALAEIKIDADGGSQADSSEATLNANIKLAQTDISIASIGVGKAGATGASTANIRRGVEANEHTILSNINLTLGASDVNVQLGHQPQGAMIDLTGTITDGITISGLTLNDNDGLGGSAAGIGGAAAGVAGTLTLGTLKIVDANSSNLTASAKINIDQNLGLAVTLGNSQYDMYIQTINLGNTPSIGDVEIQGLDLHGSTVFVQGH